MPAIEQIFVDLIPVPSRHRPVNEDAVSSLADSMAKIGLRTPITLRAIGETGVELVAGAHRLEAAKKLGWEKIDCIVLDCSEVEAKMWELAENLHRAELSILERGEHIKQWTELARVKGAQVAHPGKMPHEKGIAATARELGVTRKDVQRAVKIASISDEAKIAARETGLDDNQAALLEAARLPISEQATALRNRITPRKKDWEDVEEDQKRRLMSAWNAASPAVKAWFKDEIDGPIMDRRYGT